MDFRSEIKDNIHFIHCPKALEAKDNNLEALVKSWLIIESDIHILNFKEVENLEKSAYRPLLQFNQGLKSNQKRLFCMNVSSPISKQMSVDGLSSALVVVSGVEDAIAKAKVQVAAKPLVDVEFINPFVKSTQTVFETQASTPTKPLKPYAKKPGENLQMEIAGVLALKSPWFNGSISLCFRGEVFLKIYENMVGEKHTSITPEIEDAAGELLNIIFGGAKTILNDEKGYILEKSIPTILTGEKLTLHHRSSEPVILLPFESSAGLFHLEVLVDRS